MSGRCWAGMPTDVCAVECAVCHVVLHIPTRTLPAPDAHVLCRRCQARSDADIYSRTTRRANPYPVPVVTVTDATVALAYPSECPSAPSRVCMYFGCGARISPDMPGDECMTCARAGFARPPALVPKRIPRHIRSTGIATETRVKVACELVYPDDAPQQPGWRRSTEDGEPEPEPVYPEDAAMCAFATSSMRQTNMSHPTLFKDGPQTTPPLQDNTVLVNRNLPRRFWTPRCGETLHAHGAMEQCARHKNEDWKRQRWSSMNALNASQCRRTSSMTATTSVEEKEILTMLDDTSNGEEESVASLPNAPPDAESGNDTRRDHGINSISGWDSDLTDLSSLDSSSESTSDLGSSTSNEPDDTLSKPGGNTTSLKIRIPLLVTRFPPGSPLRKCGNKRCNIAIPKDHRWKTCDPCRRSQRMYQRIRSENIRRSILNMQLLKRPSRPCSRWRSLSPEMRESEMRLTPETSRPCSACRHRIPLPAVYRWKTCVGCRAKARRMARQKRDALFETQDALGPPDVVPRVHAYQNQGMLLSSFESQLKGFIEGQILYFRAKLREGQDKAWRHENAPMILIFAGEYSIVTGSRDENTGHSHDGDALVSSNDSRDTEAMRQEVSSVVSGLERVLRAKMRPGEAISIDQGGIVMRFACTLELIAPLRPLGIIASNALEANMNAGRDAGGSPTSVVPLAKTFSGEVETVVVPDESHRLFRGRRVVVRYRMVG